MAPIRSDIQPFLTELKWSKTKLAERLGVHRNTVTDWAAKGAPVYAIRYLEIAVQVQRVLA